MNRSFSVMKNNNEPPKPISSRKTFFNSTAETSFAPPTRRNKEQSKFYNEKSNVLVYRVTEELWKMKFSEPINTIIDVNPNEIFSKVFAHYEQTNPFFSGAVVVFANNDLPTDMKIKHLFDDGRHLVLQNKSYIILFTVYKEELSLSRQDVEKLLDRFLKVRPPKETVYGNMIKVDESVLNNPDLANMLENRPTKGDLIDKKILLVEEENASSKLKKKNLSKHKSLTLDPLEVDENSVFDLSATPIRLRQVVNQNTYRLSGFLIHKLQTKKGKPESWARRWVRLDGVSLFLHKTDAQSPELMYIPLNEFSFRYVGHVAVEFTDIDKSAKKKQKKFCFVLMIENAEDCVLCADTMSELQEWREVFYIIEMKNFASLQKGTRAKHENLEEHIINEYNLLLEQKNDIQSKYGPEKYTDFVDSYKTKIKELQIC